MRDAKQLRSADLHLGGPTWAQDSLKHQNMMLLSEIDFAVHQPCPLRLTPGKLMAAVVLKRPCGPVRLSVRAGTVLVVASELQVRWALELQDERNYT